MRYKGKKKLNVRFYVFLAVTAAMVLFLSAGAYLLLTREDASKKTIFAPEKKVESYEISLLCAGDIMEHEPQLKAQYDAASGTYQFDNNYAYVKDLIQAADLSLCNVETVFGGGQPEGYPLFNAPDSLAEAIKNAGFDVAFTANNHMLDQGGEGVLRSVDVLEGNGLEAVGSKKTPEEPNYALVDVEDITVGLVAYTYETTGSGSRRLINGLPVPQALSDQICSFNPARWEAETEKIAADLNQAQAAGADVLVCYLHWGEEYHTQPSQYQTKMAEKLIADTSVDVIFASHPHVLQPAQMLYDQAEEKNVALFYSMGNFISNQRSETLGNRLTEDGILAQVDFEITKTDDAVSKIELVRSTALPTWVNRYGDGTGKYVYEILPLTGDFESLASLTASGHVDKARQSVVDSLNLIGGGYTKDEKGRIVIFDKVAWLLANGYDENGMKRES